MPENLFIAGDWGNSRLRLYLCEIPESGIARAVETRQGPGVLLCNSDFEAALSSRCADWRQTYGALPTILSGAIGSTAGWYDAPYSKCPAGAPNIIDSRIQITSLGYDISIIGGLKTVNPLGDADVLRGEELQWLGWAAMQPEITTQQHLLCLPGTHNKWLLGEQSEVQNFLTGYTGELFELLCQRSLLIDPAETPKFDASTFLQGVDKVSTLGEAQFIHALFATRSKQVLGEMQTASAQSYLSGLIIGADILGAAKLLAAAISAEAPVIVIAENELAEKYQLAMQHLHIECQCLDAAAVSVAGFGQIYKALQQGDKQRAVS